jgi:acyl-CoA synthetase (NDP forming)
MRRGTGRRHAGIAGKTQDELRAILPFAAFRNPVDCTAHIINDTSLLDKFLGARMREGDYKSVACFFAPDRRHGRVPEKCCGMS